MSNDLVVVRGGAIPDPVRNKPKAKTKPKLQVAADEFVRNGGNVTGAAQVANISPITLTRWLKTDEGVNAVQKELRNRMSLMSVKALTTLDRLSDRARSERVQLEASVAVLDRSGFLEERQALGPAITVNFNLGPPGG